MFFPFLYKMTELLINFYFFFVEMEFLINP